MWRVRAPGAAIAFRIALLYAVFAAAWITFSDRLLFRLVSDPALLTVFQNYKGWAFVALTAALLYFALRVPITALKQREEKERRAARSFRLLSRCNEAIAQAEEETLLLQEVCRLLVEEGGYRLAWVGFTEAGPAKKVRPVAQAGFDAGYPEALAITGDEAVTGREPMGTAICTGRPAVCRNVGTGPAYAPWHEQAARRGYASAIALPLADEKGVFGALNIYAAEPEAFDPDEEEFLTWLAGNLSFGLRALRERAALQESEERYRRFVRQATDGIILVDEEGRIWDCNPSACNMLGYPREELLGKDLRDLIPPEDLEAQPLPIKEALTGKPQYFRQQFEHKDGTRVFTEANVVRLEKGLVLGIMRDISTQVQAQEEVLRQAARAQALLKIASRLNADLELETVLRVVCKETRAALRASMAVFLLYNGEKEAFRFAAGSGLPHGLAQAIELLPRAAYNELIRKLGPRGLIPDLASVPDMPYAALFREHGIRSCIYASLERGGSPVGLLVAGFTGEKCAIPGDAVDLIAGLADQATSSVCNARLFAEAKRRLEQVQALRRIDMAITGSLDLRVIFQVVLNEVTGLLKAGAAAVLRRDPYSGTLRYEAWRGFRAADPGRLHLRPGEGWGGRAVLEHRSVYIPDLRRVEWDPVQGPLLEKEGFAAYYALPLIAKGHVQGVLEVFNRKPLETDGTWLEFLEALAGQAAIAIDNAALFHNLERANVELLQAYDATIEGWAFALGLKDEETEGHSRRVTEMTLRIAREMGMKEEKLAHVRRGALLHDIGKMGIPDAILLKPGRLTDEEWEIMRRHPRYAFEMLSPIAFLRPALDIPYCHHEKWDGTGYPRGLKEEQIPLAARIFAVVDVYDALTSDRPYRPAWPQEKASAYLREQAGRHFDPRVVEVFRALWERGQLL
jgi:PAS domain S-box-containing protein/putative nucleotidyltransferase with HDIG domain